MEQVPHIAIYCQEVPEYLGHAVSHHLLPLVVKFLVDNNHQEQYCVHCRPHCLQIYGRLDGWHNVDLAGLTLLATPSKIKNDGVMLILLSQRLVRH